MAKKNVPEPVKPSTVRTALVVFLALVVAIVAGVIVFGTAHAFGLAVHAGGAAFPGAWRSRPGAHRTSATRPGRSNPPD